MGRGDYQDFTEAPRRVKESSSFGHLPPCERDSRWATTEATVPVRAIPLPNGNKVVKLEHLPPSRCEQEAGPALFPQKFQTAQFLSGAANSPLTQPARSQLSNSIQRISGDYRRGTDGEDQQQYYDSIFVSSKVIKFNQQNSHRYRFGSSVFGKQSPLLQANRALRKPQDS